MTAAHRADPAFRANSSLMRRRFTPGRICPFCCCGIARVEDMAVDHEVPLSQGGTHDMANLRYAHSWCNSAGMSRPAPLRYRTPPSDQGGEIVHRLEMPEYLRSDIERR